MDDAADSEEGARRRARSFARPNWAVAAYSIGLLVVWAAIAYGGDRYWLPTVMMFGPKWIYATPIPMLLLWMIMMRASRTSWLVLAAAILVLVFPISRFCLPQNPFARSDVRALRVLTLNAAGGDFDVSRLQTLLDTTGPDVVCIQEYGGDVKKALDADWTVHQAGQLLVASRHPAVIVATVKRRAAGRWPRPVCLVLQMTVDKHPLHFVTVHLLSPRRGLAEITNSRTILAPSKRGLLEAEIGARGDESSQVHATVEALEGPVVIAGDFNTPTSSSIYRRSWSEFQNAFSLTGFGFGHTIWLKEGNIRFSARVDQVLASGHLTPIACWVGPDVGSDHRPLIADFLFSGED